jgi:hypothetical protein
MANHGKLEEYDSQEEWSQYIERLEFEIRWPMQI